jgi:hypothetical protein
MVLRQAGVMMMITGFFNLRHFERERETDRETDALLLYFHLLLLDSTVRETDGKKSWRRQR